MTASDGVALRFVAPDDPLVERELALRFRVLRDPLGLGPDTVRFPFEHESLHLLALSGTEVVGCVLFHPGPDATGKLYQMAVAPERQRHGLGSRLVRTLEARLRQDGIGRVFLHARVPVTGFYQALGYRPVGAPFDEVGMAHQRMEKALG